MSGALGRFRALPLRSRLALLTATAVAIAVAAVAAACWFVTRAQLEEQLDDSLRSVEVGQDYVQQLRVGCASRQAAGQALGMYVVQLVPVSGEPCTSPGAPAIPVRPVDTAVARGEQPFALHTTPDADGRDMRVYTYHFRDARQNLLPGPPFAVSIARPMSEVDEPLGSLAWVLLALSGIGVLGAGATGLLVARAGLRPVDKLADTVEHVARTEDLTVRIPVDGEDEIARLSRSFNAMTGALASSRDRQAQLIADAGHELRTPLTSLRTNVELLVRSDETGRAIPPADRAALMASVKAQMTELAALIGDLQELARPDTAGQGGPLRVIALHEIATAALERARLRGPELTINADLRPWYVRAEPAALERALVNVLDNAVKFSPAGGTVDVALNQQGELTVRDHGPGVPDAELPHVFERFWRSPSARALPGSGLGLSIVARTVQQAGGTVTLRRPRDGAGGTEALIRLPGAPTPPPPDATA
ncbi:two-component sensor histidine kinase [Streptomyces agglomeratus]|uniref:sensor histidine kinase n=1 Tax=Streptomyces agglomeratus TaxID=285458 RepID=UPI000854ADD0|nr:HAMP domain-containing sensor histidine kinase [Streptomyces agglomeratus]OEJ39705.1 two-component sensor histidine kinase [Streptomyces agglomeratus]OEJ45912.1 two-component sensor histidine kinase [Streptomyces agglomeratus]OEJ59624.1 two-component sensor histidine kinase [Streptomyces agglomeratus]